MKKVDGVNTNVKEAQRAIKNLVIYDALDGSRTTLKLKPFIEPKHDTTLFSIGLIHTLQALGVKSCVVMVHTSYNRERGGNEFKNVLELIKSGADLIKKYSIDGDIRCNCLCMNKDYELIGLLEEVQHQTWNGDFNAYFLFDYNEEWFWIRGGYNMLNKLPLIDVHIRHTKFNFSGGWIPNKMSRSAFVYSQNGSSYSNWEPDELVAQVAVALLAKKLNKGEGLSKVYSNYDEIQQRYKKREIDLFQNTIYLRNNPKKLFIIGSPIGPLIIYY